MTKYSSEFKAKVANEYFQGDITYQALAKKSYWCGGGG
ncbi:transposase [Lacticaseibacillus pantheris]|nr:transposase [Lacticaseibacillus pantheris]WKF85046.1 transposase [Lacticaseibacillus pantheris]